MIRFEDDALFDSASTSARRDPLGPEVEIAAPLSRAPASLPAAFRPREKILARGASHLSRAELLALVLGTGTRGEPAARTAERLLRRHGLRGLSELPASALSDERGIGRAGAGRLAAVFEIGRRLYRADPASERPKLTRPGEVYRLVADLARAKKEHLLGLYLDAQNGLIHRETLSVGSLNTTRTHPREILYPAIQHLALGFILVHNHPSGGLDPSDEDVAFTRGVQRAGEIMGIELYDHVIVAKGGYASLRERGVL